MASLQRFVPATCPTEVQQVELRATRRGEKLSPKLVLHNYKSISLHEGTCRCNISLRHVPATFSCMCKCCDFVPATYPRYTSLLHVASVCTAQGFCRCSMSLRHVPATSPLVSAHLKCLSIARIWFVDRFSQPMRSLTFEITEFMELCRWKSRITDYI